MLTKKEDRLLLTVKAIANSSRTHIAGVLGKPTVALKIKVAQPPEEGRANRAIVSLLAQTLQIPESQIVLLTGQTRPHKTFQINGLTLDAITQRLQAAMRR